MLLLGVFAMRFCCSGNTLVLTRIQLKAQSQRQSSGSECKCVRKSKYLILSGCFDFLSQLISFPLISNFLLKCTFGSYFASEFNYKVHFYRHLNTQTMLHLCTCHITSGCSRRGASMFFFKVALSF